MPRVRELLDRFRPAGAPGSASAAGVPADRRAGVEAELEPVFAALAGVEAECARLRTAAAAEAGTRTRAATARAAAIVAAADEATAPAQASAAAAARQRAAEETAHLTAAAERDAASVRESAIHRRPLLVARVLDEVRRELAALPGAPS
jgi:hypothetical protein